MKLKKISVILLLMVCGIWCFSAEIPGIVLGNGINIRAGNGTQFDVIYKARTGEIYPVESIENNGWFKISLPDKINGFIRNDFLKIEPGSTFPMTVEVNASRVNVRMGPGVGSRWITRFYHGDQLRAYSEVGDWYNIQYSKKRSGYIISKYFDLLDNRKGFVTADCVNIRSKPSLDKTVVAKLYYECPVIFLDQNDKWYKIKIRGGPVGWIYKKYVNFDGQGINIPDSTPSPSIDTRTIPDPGDAFDELKFND